MNKNCLLLLIVTLLFAMPTKADTSGTCGDNLKWEFIEATGTLKITGTGPMTDYNNGYVSGKYEPAPWQDLRLSIKKVDIAKGITAIGSCAFSRCIYLSNVNFSNAITKIGDFAFYECDDLSDVVFPNGITKIGDFAFGRCRQLLSITIPASVDSMGKGVFAYCHGIETIVVDKENKIFDSRDNCNAIINTISNELVAGCSSTKIPNGVVAIGDYAFAGWNREGRFATIDIPNSVTSIGEGAFRGCSFSYITIPSSVIRIGKGLFTNCSKITRIIVDKSNPIYDSRNDCNAIIKTADNELVVGCQKTIIPSSVTSIGDSAFVDDNLLISIKIPEGVNHIGNGSFQNCFYLESISLPKSLVKIGEGAFLRCENLKSIDLPEGITEIGVYAFEECKSIKAISIPGNLTTISSWAFAHCSGLQSITISEGVKIIGNDAFSRCDKITSINIPASVEDISWGAFRHCTNLSTVYVNAAKQRFLYTGMFDDNAEGRKIYVQDESVDYYKAGWPEYADDIFPMSSSDKEDVGKCGADLTYRYSELSGTLTVLGKGDMNDYDSDSPAPWYNYNITKLDINDGVTSIGNYAFVNSSMVKEISIGKDVSSIGKKSFSNVGNTTSAQTRTDKEGIIVKCYPKSVPNTALDAFDNTPLEKATLFVNEESVDDYKLSAPWNGFSVIKGLGEATDIKRIISNSYSTPNQYFNLNGQKFKNPHQKGLFIINGKKVLVK